MTAPVWLTLARGPQSEPVAARVVRALGARADMPIDRLEDGAVVAAEVVALALGTNERVEMRLRRLERGIEVAVADPDGSLARDVSSDVGEWAIVRTVSTRTSSERADGRMWLVVQVAADPAD